MRIVRMRITDKRWNADGTLLVTSALFLIWETI